MFARYIAKRAVVGHCSKISVIWGVCHHSVKNRKPRVVIETLGFNPFYPRETEESRLEALEKFKADVDKLYNKHGANHIEEPVVQIHSGRKTRWVRN